MSTQFSTLFNRYLLTGFGDGPVCQIPESPPDLRHKSSLSYLPFVYCNIFKSASRPGHLLPSRLHPFSMLKPFIFHFNFK